jgi:outer membrane protein assembly factor BamB
VDADDFQVRANAQSPYGRSTATIEIEACPTGVAFGSGSCRRASSASADTGASATGAQLTGSVGSLGNGTLYRWRSRAWWKLNGIWQHGPWRRLSGQGTEADIRVAADLDGDGVAPPRDCDETDNSIYLGAPELCDSKDNNCDGQVDEPAFAGLASASALGGSECGIRLDWPTTSACSGSPLYSVYRSTATGFTPGAGNLRATCISQSFFIDTSVAAGTPYHYVVRAENPSTGGSGPCYGGGEETNVVRRSATASACSAASGDVLYLTARAGDSTVRLEWVNPGPVYAFTRLCVKAGGYPTGPSDAGSTCTDVGAPDDAGAYGTTTFSSLGNGTQHYFAAYVWSGSAFSGGKYTQARPFDTTTAGKWAYSSAATALAPSGIRPNFASYAFSNDRILHAVAAGAGGGTWPPGWVPASMNAPAQARPTLVTFPSLTILGASSVAFAGAQDGRVYAFNALSGATLWSSPMLGDAVQAGPSIIATDFGGVANLALVATRTPGGDSKIYGLNLADGSIAWTFSNGGGTDGIGIISSQVSAEPSSSRLWVTSRSKPGGSASTVWCLSFTATSAAKVWARALGDVDAAAILRENRLYVGTNAGTIHALDPSSGAELWGAPYATLDGAVKSFVWVEVTGALTRLYCSTNTKIHALDDGGSSATTLWSAYSTAAPSPVVVINGSLYVGTSSINGQILRMDALTGTLLGAVALGDPAVAKTVGAPSFDSKAKQVIAGTDQGAVYAVAAPF